MQDKKPEKKVQSEIIKLLKDEGYYYAKTQKTSMNGVPDILCCIEGRFAGIEVKAEGKRENITALQTKNLADIRIAGGYALCTDNVEDVKTLIKTIKDRECL